MKLVNPLIASVITCSLLMLTPGQARADGEEFCNAVGAFIGAVAGYLLTGPLSAAIQAGSAAAGAYIGTSQFGETCHQGLHDFADHYQQNPIDYDEFVRVSCNGNPLTCPGNFNPMSDPSTTDWTGNTNPLNCSTFIVCAVPIAMHDDNTISVQDLINAMAFVKYSHNAGYWDTYNYGYLVNYQDPWDDVEEY